MKPLNEQDLPAMPDDQSQIDPDAAGMGATTPAAGEPMAANEDCIPLAALAMPDSESGDKMTNPELGDKVTYTVEGTVSRIEGDQAYVKRETVNGQDVAGVSGPPDDEQAENGSEGAGLRGEAQEMPGMT